MGCLVVLLLLPLNGSTIFDQESRVPGLSRELIDDDLLPGRLRRSQADQRARQRQRQREMDRDRERPTIGGTAQSSRQFRRKTPISSWHAMASSSTAKMTDVVRPIRLSLPLSLSLSSSLCFVSVSAFLLLLLQLFSFSHFWLRFFTVLSAYSSSSYHIQWSLNRLRFWTVSRSAPAPECSFSAAALCFCFRPYIVFTGRLFLWVCTVYGTYVLWTSRDSVWNGS